MLADAQTQFGASKFIVRTGGGGFHAYYRHNGEGRKIRLDPSRPVDLLGRGGPIVLPPSQGRLAKYEIIHGTLDDLTALTSIQNPVALVPAANETRLANLRSARDGERDGKFWPHVARQAHQVPSLEALIEVAREMNELMAEPWPDSEVDSEIVKRCKYWWEKTQKGENRFGVGKFVTMDHAVIDNLMMTDPDAFQLLMFLRRHHWGRDFALANEACKLLPLNGSKRGQLGWDRERFTDSRSRLIEAGFLIMVQPPSFKPNRPMICRLG